MRIDFFEEYPNEERLAPLSLINFPSTLFLGGKTHQDFVQAKNLAKTKTSKLEYVWWPLYEESHWLSPFTPPNEIERVKNEILNSGEDSIFLDFEPPIKSSLYGKYWKSFFSSKKAIQELVSLAHQMGMTVYAAEYMSMSYVQDWLMRLAGLSLPFSTPHVKIPMSYASHMKSTTQHNLVRKHIAKHAKKHPQQLAVGIGLIYAGPGTEKKINAQQLRDELVYYQEKHVQHVIVFTSNGLTEEYVSVLKEFL